MTYEVKIEKNKIYSFIRDKWLELTPEEQVRQGFVCHLMNHYGYKLEQMSEELTVSNASRGQYINKYGDKYKDCLLTEDDVGKAINKRFDIGSKLTEVLFIERCLNLLKKGGRLGIVLPDGVLNGANLQKCRDFVEGKAKILMITSIPQDVFVAAGATVKPSLLFFKKFTEEEELLYNQIFL